jgi:hypothetical protein
MRTCVLIDGNVHRFGFFFLQASTGPFGIKPEAELEFLLLSGGARGRSRFAAESGGDLV